MTKTLCELLREAGSKDQCVARDWGEEGEDYGGVCLDAADEIERLQALVKEYRENGDRLVAAADAWRYVEKANADEPTEPTA